MKLSPDSFLKNPDIIRKCYVRHLAEFSEMKNTLGDGGYMTAKQLFAKGLMPALPLKQFTTLTEEKMLPKSEKDSNLSVPLVTSSVIPVLSLTLPSTLQTSSSSLLSQQSIFKKETTDGLQPQSERQSHESMPHTSASFKQIG